MKWYEMAENPLAISSLYERVPDLQDMSVKGMMLLQSNAMEITVSLSRLPDKLPSRRHLQKTGYKYLRLHFFFLDSLHIYGGSANSNVFDMRIEKVDRGFIAFEAVSSHCYFKGRSLGFRMYWLKG